MVFVDGVPAESQLPVEFWEISQVSVKTLIVHISSILVNFGNLRYQLSEKNRPIFLLTAKNLANLQFLQNAIRIPQPTRVIFNKCPPCVLCIECGWKRDIMPPPINCSKLKTDTTRSISRFKRFCFLIQNQELLYSRTSALWKQVTCRWVDIDPKYKKFAKKLLYFLVFCHIWRTRSRQNYPTAERF